MDITLEEQELEVICESLQFAEEQLAQSEPDSERLKAVRKVFQRLQTLRTAKIGP